MDAAGGCNHTSSRSVTFVICTLLMDTANQSATNLNVEADCKRDNQDCRKRNSIDNGTCLATSSA